MNRTVALVGIIFLGLAFLVFRQQRMIDEMRFRQLELEKQVVQLAQEKSEAVKARAALASRSAAAREALAKAPATTPAAGQTAKQP
jgi:hypothetical protein